MIFKKRCKCILCGKYYEYDRMRHMYERIGVCCRCAEELPRITGMCSLDYNAESLVISPYFYTGTLRNAVLEYKFNGQMLYGFLFGNMLAHELRGSNHIAGIDLVIPVPLHKNRLRERGYNQSEIIAQIFAEETDIPCIPEAIERIKDTKRQSGLTGADRINNVRDAFSADADIVSGKRILLIDDISTMGMTMNSCKRALISAGAASVSPTALCKTPRKIRK